MVKLKRNQCWIKHTLTSTVNTHLRRHRKQRTEILGLEIIRNSWKTLFFFEMRHSIKSIVMYKDVKQNLNIKNWNPHKCQGKWIWYTHLIEYILFKQCKNMHGKSRKEYTKIIIVIFWGLSLWSLFFFLYPPNFLCNLKKFLLFYYSYVHTMLGSFLPPV
jgi:hypothetical protein